MICKICGREIEDGEQFCNFCGASQSAKPSQFDVTSSLVEQERVIKKKAAKRTLILVVAIIVVIVALFVALLSTGILGNIFGNGGSDQSAEEPTSTIEAPAQPAAEETETSPAVAEATETSPAVAETATDANTTIAATSKESTQFVHDAGQKDFIGEWVCHEYDEDNSVLDEFIVSFNGSGFRNSYYKKENEGTWSYPTRYSVSEGVSSALDGSFGFVENNSPGNGSNSKYTFVFVPNQDSETAHSKKQYEFEKVSDEHFITTGLASTFGTWYGQDNDLTVIFGNDGSFSYSNTAGGNDSGWWRLFAPANGSPVQVQAYSTKGDASYTFVYNADFDFQNPQGGILTSEDLTFQKTPPQSSGTENAPENSGTNPKTEKA